jgi:predicted kinase
VATLIHLNGPPGIGKSTLAARYVERHPGTLDLDIDTLHRLVGGWRDPENHTHEVLRPVALAMAATHLGGGRDVILPQYLAQVEEIAAFEKVARDRSADFREIVLLDDLESSIARFERRPDRGEWDEHNRRLVASWGGAAFLADLHDRLLEVLRHRPSAVIIRSEPDSIEETYALLEQALLELAP